MSDPDGSQRDVNASLWFAAPVALLRGRSYIPSSQSAVGRDTGFRQFACRAHTPWVQLLKCSGMAPDFDLLRRGRRRPYRLTVMDTRGSYPSIQFRTSSAVYIARDDAVYSLVEATPPNEFGFSEIHWNNLSEIRLWGALALSIREGEGFYRFVPAQASEELPVSLVLATSPRTDVAERLVGEMLKKAPGREYDLHWIKPDPLEVIRLYEALGEANDAILRGVNCFMKSLLIWSIRESALLTRDVGMILLRSLILVSVFVPRWEKEHDSLCHSADADLDR